METENQETQNQVAMYQDLNTAPQADPEPESDNPEINFLSNPHPSFWD